MDVRPRSGKRRVGAHSLHCERAARRLPHRLGPRAVAAAGRQRGGVPRVRPRRCRHYGRVPIELRHECLGRGRRRVQPRHLLSVQPLRRSRAYARGWISPRRLQQLERIRYWRTDQRAAQHARRDAGRRARVCIHRRIERRHVECVLSPYDYRYDDIVFFRAISSHPSRLAPRIPY